MKTKPILFNTEMVCAILKGKKTVTRRPIKLDLGLADTDKNDSSYLKIPDKDGEYHDAKHLCRYQPGDILYVRETWQDGSLLEDDKGNAIKYIYKADDTDNSYKSWKIKWRPSIHMPKKAARIFLKVTDVKVERLKDHVLDSWEYEKEGLWLYSKKYREEICINRDSMLGLRITRIKYFRELWNSTIKKQDLGRYGWEADPWVWVIEFERLQHQNKEGDRKC